MKRTELQTRILAKMLGGKRTSIVELCNSLDSSPAKVQQAIKGLIKEGHSLDIDHHFNIEFSKTLPKKANLTIDTKDYFGSDWIRFGAIADTHLCSKYERLDVLNALYDIYEKEGIQNVYHAGNWIDGYGNFNKYDVYCIGFENQVDYFVKNFPKRKNITTFIISGDDHEGWILQREGINVGKVMQDRAVQAGRNDLIDLGYMERDIDFKKGKGKSTLRIIHAGGGSAYATSYTVQKIAESYQGGEKPNFVIVGHFHKFDYNYPREISMLQPGCTEDQTPFMRKKRIQAMVGGCIVELKQDDKGVFVRRRIEWIPFFDKKYFSYR